MNTHAELARRWTLAASLAAERRKNSIQRYHEYTWFEDVNSRAFGDLITAIALAESDFSVFSHSDSSDGITQINTLVRDPPFDPYAEPWQLVEWTTRTMHALIRRNGIWGAMAEYAYGRAGAQRRNITPYMSRLVRRMITVRQMRGTRGVFWTPPPDVASAWDSHATTERRDRSADTPASDRLTPNTAALADRLRTAGYRVGGWTSTGEHSTGRALDVFTNHAYNTASWLVREGLISQHRVRLIIADGVAFDITDRGYKPYSVMTDAVSAERVRDHFNHVHIRTRF